MLSNVASVVTHSSISVLQLQRRLSVAKEDLWDCEAGSVSFFELLHERLSNDHIIVSTVLKTTVLCLFRLSTHGPIISRMDNCPVLSFLALSLELAIFLKDRGKTILFKHASLMHNGILGCGQIFKVVEQRDIVS